MVDDSGTVVLNTTISTNVPPVFRRFGFGVTATITTAGTNHQIMSIDYMGMGRQKPNFLNAF
jgi:membrane protein YdbS with pleckstrin-like domain